MLFFAIYYCEDVTPRAFKQCLLLQRSLKLENLSAKYFSNLIEFCLNVYTTKTQMSEVFEILKAKLEIRHWEKSKLSEVEIFTKARQIYRVVKEKFGINLFALQNELSDFESKNKDFFYAQISAKFPFFIDIFNTIRKFKESLRVFDNK